MIIFLSLLFINGNEVKIRFCMLFLSLLQELWWSSLQLCRTALGERSVLRVLLQSLWGGEQGECCGCIKVISLSIKQLFYLCSHQFLSHPLQNKRENPIHIINVSIKTADTEDDDALVTAFTAFAQSKVCYFLWHMTDSECEILFQFFYIE